MRPLLLAIVLLATAPAAHAEFGAGSTALIREGLGAVADDTAGAGETATATVADRGTATAKAAVGSQSASVQSSQWPEEFARITQADATADWNDRIVVTAGAAGAPVEVVVTAALAVGVATVEGAAKPNDSTARYSFEITTQPAGFASMSYQVVEMWAPGFEPERQEIIDADEATSSSLRRSFTLQSGTPFDIRSRLALHAVEGASASASMAFVVIELPPDATLTSDSGLLYAPEPGAAWMAAACALAARAWWRRPRAQAPARPAPARS